MELKEGELLVRTEVKEIGGKYSLDLELRRKGRLGLKIHERIPSSEKIKEILERPRWLGDESDNLIRKCLASLLEVRDEETGGM